jgi:hypothetical protein
MPSSRDASGFSPDDPADPLFAVPPAEFVAARNELASELKRAGKKNEAAAVKAMAKPSSTVWAVNRLAREAGDELERFLAISDDVWRAQSAGAADENARRAYQSSLTAQREALDPLVDRAAAICADHKVTTNRSVLEGIANNLRFAAVDETARAQLVAGRLLKDVEPPDFSALIGRIPLTDRSARPAAASPPAKPAPHGAPARFHARPANDAEAPPAGARSGRADEEDDADEDEAQTKAEREAEAKRRTQARLQAQALKSELKPLETQVQRTRAKVASLAQKQERAEATFEDLRRQLARAETEVETANTAHEQAVDELAKEEARIGELRAALERAEAAAKPQT